MPLERVEVNGAFGQDENRGKDLARFPYASYGFPAFKKNRAAFGNVIYKPNNSLLFALEYRRILTILSGSPAAIGDQVKNFFLLSR